MRSIILWAFALFLAAPLAAQAPGAPVTFTAFAGQVSPYHSLDDGTDLGNGTSLGLGATIWISEWAGVRLSGFWDERTVTAGETPLSSRDLTSYLFSAEGAFSLHEILPLPAQLRPYIVGGIGLRNREFSGYRAVDGFAFSGGIGTEYLVGPVGVGVEVRNVTSRLEHFQNDRLVHELLYAVGLTLRP